MEKTLLRVTAVDSAGDGWRRFGRRISDAGGGVEEGRGLVGSALPSQRKKGNTWTRTTDRGGVTEYD